MSGYFLTFFRKGDGGGNFFCSHPSSFSSFFYLPPPLFLTRHPRVHSSQGAAGCAVWKEGERQKNLGMDVRNSFCPLSLSVPSSFSDGYRGYGAGVGKREEDDREVRERGGCSLLLFSLLPFENFFLLLLPFFFFFSSPPRLLFLGSTFVLSSCAPCGGGGGSGGGSVVVVGPFSASLSRR